MDTIVKSFFSEDYIKAFTEKWMREEQVRKEKISNMLETDNYINWLDEFTKQYINISDIQWIYFPERISKEDNENVNDLHILYEIVSNYAERNFYTAYKCDFGNFYIVKIKGVFYRIGIDCGQGTMFYCNRLDETSYKAPIDFEDVRNDVEQPYVKKYETKLEGFKSHIIKLKEDGIPEPYIRECVEQTLKET